MKRAIGLVLGAAIVVATPATAKKIEMTPMELQSLQSREYQASKEQMFAAIMSVFQDLGYQIRSAEVGSGFITAESANNSKTSFFEALGGMNSSGSTQATAFVETMPSGMSRVRLNFMNTKNTSFRYGQQSKNDRPILEPKTYQLAFERIEQALFERNALTKAPPAIGPVAATAQTTATSTQGPASVQPH